MESSELKVRVICNPASSGGGYETTSKMAHLDDALAFDTYCLKEKLPLRFPGPTPTAMKRVGPIVHR